MVPFQTPVEMVPRVVRFVEPAQVERAVFSTLPRPTLALVKVGLAISPRLLKAVKALPDGWTIGVEL